MYLPVNPINGSQNIYWNYFSFSNYKVNVLFVCFTFCYGNIPLVYHFEARCFGVVFAQKVLIEVPGMVCQMCVQGMQKNFKTAVVDPEKDVIVDLDKKTVTVTLKKKISEKEITDRVNDAGYNPEKIT